MKLKKPNPDDTLYVTRLKPSEFEAVRKNVPYSGASGPVIFFGMSSAPYISTWCREIGRIIELLKWKSGDFSLIEGENNKWTLQKDK